MFHDRNCQCKFCNGFHENSVYPLWAQYKTIHKHNTRLQHRLFCPAICTKSHRAPKYKETTEKNQLSWGFLVAPFKFINSLDYHIQFFPLGTAERNFSNDIILLQFLYVGAGHILTLPSIFHIFNDRTSFSLGRNGKNVLNIYTVHRKKKNPASSVPFIKMLYCYFYFFTIR